MEFWLRFAMQMRDGLPIVRQSNNVELMVQRNELWEEQHRLGARKKVKELKNDKVKVMDGNVVISDCLPRGKSL